MTTPVAAGPQAGETLSENDKLVLALAIAPIKPARPCSPAPPQRPDWNRATRETPDT